MAEVVGSSRALGPAQEKVLSVDNENVSVLITATTLVSKLESIGYSEFSLTTHNGNGVETLTVQIKVSNKDNPNTDLTNADWAQLGSDITVGPNGEDASQFSGRYKYVGVTATATGNTSSDVDVHFLMSRL